MEKNTHLSYLCYAKLGTQARYMCFICVELSWKHKLRDFKQDGVMLISAAKHHIELRLHPMNTKDIGRLDVLKQKDLFSAEGKQGYEVGSG